MMQHFDGGIETERRSEAASCIFHIKRDATDAGGLLSYASISAKNWSLAASHVDKILKGTKPADLPVQQPTEFKLVINLKTAKALRSLSTRMRQSVLGFSE